MRSYLSRLKFDPHLLRLPQAKFLQNIRFPALFIVLVAALGLWSYFTVPRTLNPEINIPIVITSTVLPGASPQEIESLITVPLEKAIKNVTGISTYTSNSSENSSFIMAEFVSGTDPQTAQDEVRNAIINVDLPEDALDPTVTKLDFENIPSYIFSLTVKNPQDWPSLMRLADQLKDTLEAETGIDRVVISGFDSQNIAVIASLPKIIDAGIDPMSLSASLKAAINAYPAGQVKNNGFNYPVSLNKTVASVDDIRQIPVSVPGKAPVKLGSVAQVNQRSLPDQNLSYVADPENPVQPAVKLAVYKSDSSRLDTIAHLTAGKIKDTLAPYGDYYQTRVIIDYAEETAAQFNELTNNFIQTLVLVFLSMFLVYGLRQALVASVAIPFPLLMTFTVMKATNIGLNFLSIFSLLLALGLFVDNTVVIIEAFTSYIKTKKFSILETALLVWRDFSVPLFSINLVTVWAFLPLIFSGGIIGEFIKPIPIIVSASMFASVAIALLFTLPSMMYLTRPRFPRRVQLAFKALAAILILLAGIVMVPKSAVFMPTLLVYLLTITVILVTRRQLIQIGLSQLKRLPKFRQIKQRVLDSFNHGLISLQPIIDTYRHYLEKLVVSRRARKKALAIIIIFSIFTYALLPLGLVVNEFFPKSDTKNLYVDIELPVGANRDLVQADALNLLEQLRQEPEVKTAYLDLGGSSAQRQSFSDIGSANLASITLSLGERNTRKSSSIEIAQRLRKKYATTEGKTISIIEESGGPPAGSDVVVTLLGENLGQLEAYADQIEANMRAGSGYTNINRSIKPSPSKITFIPDTAALQYYGLNEAILGSALRTLVSGMTLTKVRFDVQETDVNFRYDSQLINPSALSTLSIPSGSKRIPITELGEFVLQANPSQIARDNGQRSLTVSAGALPGFSVSRLNAEVKKFMDSKLILAEGYAWKTGGANEENAKSIQSILQAMLLSAILILITMIVQLGSFRKALLVMLVIPLAVSGVFFWFALLGIPLSFPALIGVLSLFGIVIANSIVLVDKINQNLKAGFDKNTSLIDAGASRLEPILLTSLASIVGLIPITLADPLWLGLGGAIIAGLSVSGVLMLFFTPIMYLYLYPGKTEGH